MTSRCLALLLALITPALHAEEAKTVDNPPKLAYGQMMKQGDKLVFAPCRDRSYLMVEDVSGDGAVLRGLDQVGLSAGKKLYVELLATAEGSTLKAAGLNFAHTEGRCQQPGGSDESWRATGNEPGWMLAIGAEQIVLKRLGQADLLLPYVAPERSGRGVHLEATAGQQRLALRFEPGLCRDTMADAVFGWTARVEVNAQVLSGCAWQR